MWSAAGTARHLCRSLCRTRASGWRWLVACRALPRSANACSVRDGVGKDAGLCKHQKETTHAWLGKVGSASPAGVRYLGISSNPLPWAQSAEPPAAKVTKRAVGSVTAPSEMSSAFPLRTRLATCDASVVEPRVREVNTEGPRRRVDELITVVRRPLGRRLPRQDGVARGGCSTWPWRVG